ncbi:ead/Ea22-like family protein [Salmonella enterica]|nr:ead/Ea22-like family protein [Salmonella enterica]EKL8235355.1 ead/Ea22-like family protein [Salmonella enterica]
MTNGSGNGSESKIESNIDKRALRHAAHAAESVNSGNWSYEEFRELGLPGGAHIKIDGRDAIYCLNKPTGGIKQSRAVLAYIAAFNPKVALSLLDELEHYKSREERVTKLVLDNSTSWDVLYEKLEAAERRIAELEARAVNLPKRSVDEVMHLSGFSRDYAEGWCAGNDNAIHEIRAAGIKVKE